MKVNFTRCKEILNTLPISLYLKRSGLSADMSETEEGSYYNPMADKITISYPCVAQMLSHAKTTYGLENIIRGIMYHEVSHAILTPKYLKKSAKNNLEADLINVFEDERIETILHDFYYGVDFKENVILLNDYHGEKPENAFSAFYHTVRFRDGKPADLLTVNQIITDFWHLTSRTEYPDSDYVRQIMELYKKIAREWYEKNKPEDLENEAQEMTGSGSGSDSSGSSSSGSSGSSGNPRNRLGSSPESSSESSSKSSSGSTGEEESSGSSSSSKEETTSSSKEEGSGSSDTKKPTYDGLSETQKDEVVRRLIEKESEEGGDPHYVGVGEGDPTDGEGEDDGKYLGGKWHIPDYSDEVDAKKAVKKLTEVSYNATDFLDKTKIQKMLNSIANKFYDGKLTNDIDMIFLNFVSRSKNNAAALQRYSGVLNPRALTRDDWRIFEYKSTSGPVKGYDKLHLNLFIDTSGSFYNNEDKVNTILKSLTTLEEKYPFFYYDLVTMQRTETLRSKDERYIKTGGGNDFDDAAKSIYDRLQDPRSFNYNIVLFDGDAWTDAPRNQREAHKRNIAIFNNSKTTIISDSDNQNAIETYAPLCHQIFVGRGTSKPYSELLYDNVLAALTKALL